MNIPTIILSNSPEIIIMVGYPGSGKTTIANHIINNNNNYVHIQSNNFKSNIKKMIKYSLQYINNNQSIIFDGTNNTIQKRHLYIELSHKYNYNIRCIHLTNSLSTSFKFNKLRKNEIPKVAYFIYKKYYEEPNIIEGFKLQKI